MRAHFGILLILSLTGWVGAAPLSGVVTTETFNRSATLDTEGNYLLFWNYDESNVTFEVHVRTKGWVGFGISGNGNMFPADVVVGWVKDGTPHFADRHTVGHSAPVMDQSQDWHLLLAMENDFGTVLKFTRAIDTCDDVEDKKIEEGTVRVIYAYHTDDPTSDTSLMYHGGERRGTKSVSLLSESVQPSDFPSDVKYFDFRNNNFLMPATSTYYHCVGFMMPDIGGKHHMISVEPVITPGNEMNVHHILVYRCQGGSPKSNGAAGNCYANRPTELPECADTFVAWAIGGKSFYFPDQAGYPINEQGGSNFYIMETHYDNPNKVAGIIDNSGLRIALTPTLRQHDLGMLMIGLEVNYKQLVPPGYPAYVSRGHCSEQCLSHGLAEKNFTEVQTVAALQHSHLLGAGIKTRHIRNGVELPPLMDDPNYDFNFQEFRMTPQGKTIRSGDSFIVECTYDSRDRKGPTFGGLSTQEEMCLTFLYYYPAMNVFNCKSERDMAAGLGVAEDKLREPFEAIDWGNATHVQSFIAKVDSAPIDEACYGTDMNPPYFSQRVVQEPTPAHPFVASNTKTCSRD